MRRLTWVALLSLAAAMLVVGTAGADDDDGGTKTWRVTITNLTPVGPGVPPGAQPLSPPLVVVHSSKADVWSVGEIASHGVAAIAEDANNEPLEDALPLLAGVKSATTVPGGPIFRGAPRTFMVETEGSLNRLSIVTMLVNTNDAFTGLDSLRLRGSGETRSTNAYDAGSEVNTEQDTDIPGPCCNNPFVRVPEGNLIRHHDGIQGTGDLPQATWGWTDPVARITIERVS